MKFLLYIITLKIIIIYTEFLKESQTTNRSYSFKR